MHGAFLCAFVAVFQSAPIFVFNHFTMARWLRGKKGSVCCGVVVRARIGLRTLCAGHWKPPAGPVRSETCETAARNLRLEIFREHLGGVHTLVVLWGSVKGWNRA